MNKYDALAIAVKENCCSQETADRDYELGYLTINIGRNGKEYAWYVSDSAEWASDMDGNKLSDDEIQKLFL